MDEIKKLFSRELTADDLEALNSNRESFLEALGKIEDVAKSLDEIKSQLANEPEQKTESVDDVINSEEDE